MFPPDGLLQDCPIPESEILTNEELALWAKALRDGLIECNVDKEALRAWRDSWEKKK